MTLALTSFSAYGFERAEPLQKVFKQRIVLSITGANTDVSYDFGTYAGTFWTAVGGTLPGSLALKAIKDIQVAAKSFWLAGGTGLAGKTQVGTTGGGLIAYNSAASAGGAATEALTVTGLAVADTILAVSQQAKGANSTALNLWTDTGRTADTLTVGWTANPGSGAIVRVLTRKATTAASVFAGQYSLALDGTNGNIPNILFASGDAPTSSVIMIEWELKDQMLPIFVSG